MSLQQGVQAKKQQAWKKMSKGLHGEAVLILKKIIELKPGDAEAQYLLGCCQASRYLWDEAMRSLLASINIQPDVPQSHFALAGVYIAIEQLDKAMECLDKVLALNPNSPDVHVELGNIKIRQDEFDEARKHFEKAITLDVKTSNAYLGLALLEQDSGHHKRAIEELDTALRYMPKSVFALCAMGNSLSNLSRKDEALVYYRKALKIDKNSIEAQCSIAKLHNFNADYDKAIKLIDPLLKRKILHPTLALAFAQSCKHSGRCVEAVEYIDDVLKKPGLSRVEIKSLNFAAGKVLDTLNQFDRAFEHYKAGNDAITYLYDSVANTKNVNNIIETFTSAFFMGASVARARGKRPIFIVGMPRSGTSLTEQILAAHSNVYAAGELDTLFEIARQNRRVNEGEEAYPLYVRNLRQKDLDEMANEYLKQIIALSSQEEFVTDKMPHNFYLLGLIQLLFPNSFVIHCKRNPIDTCLSIYFQDFSEAHTYAKDLFNIGLHYHQYQRLMEHWKQVLSIPVLDVQYEELVGNQEEETRRILAFCNLEWESSCLQFYKVNRTIDTASFDQVRQPLYTKSISRWKNYEKYLDELKRGLKREV